MLVFVVEYSSNLVKIREKMAENLPKFKISKQCSLNKSSSHIHKWSLNEVLFVLAVGLLGYRSKALCSVIKAIEEQIRTLIFPGYSSTIKHCPDVVCSELGTLEWWISGSMLDPLFLIISRLK